MGKCVKGSIRLQQQEIQVLEFVPLPFLILITYRITNNNLLVQCTPFPYHHKRCPEHGMGIVRFIIVIH